MSPWSQRHDSLVDAAYLPTVYMCSLSQDTNVEDKKLKALLTQDVDYDKILVLILNTAQFEFILKNSIQALLNTKQAKWEALRKECAERMTELGEYFTGEKALTRVKKNETLMKW